MKQTVLSNLIMIGMLVWLSVPVAVMAQPEPIPHHIQGYAVDSGRHPSETTVVPSDKPVFSEVVRVPGAPWLRLYFGESRLRSGSYLVLTSLEDGAQQILDAAALELWRYSSAFFNGDAIKVELYVAPEDRDVHFGIRDVMVGERISEPRMRLKSICDGDDDRVSSNDPAVGRLVPIGCTGWIGSNGAYLTAGHCVGSAMETLEFNVPASDSDGTINHPDPEDQYPVDDGSIVYTNGGMGNDWAVFTTDLNSETGLMPVAAQESFFRMSRDSSPSTVRITGYGVDGPPPYFGTYPPRNEDSQTLQTDTGSYNGEVYNSASNVYHQYRADTQGGNSGSPIIASDVSRLSIGIHTHGGCNASGGYNRGTSFENDSLESAVQAFPGTNYVYVDGDHPSTSEDGTVLRPYDTVGEGVNAVPAGGTVSIVAGTYDESLTISDEMTLVAPVGTVIIE